MLLCFFDSFLRLPGSSDAPGLWGFSSCRLTLLVKVVCCCWPWILVPIYPPFPSCVNSSEYRRAAACVKRKVKRTCQWIGVFLLLRRRTAAIWWTSLKWLSSFPPVHSVLFSLAVVQSPIYVLRLSRPGWVTPWAGPALSRKLNHEPPGIPSSMNFRLIYVAENLIPHVHVRMHVPVLVITSPQSIGATW